MVILSGILSLCAESRVSTTKSSEHILSGIPGSHPLSLSVACVGSCGEPRGGFWEGVGLVVFLLELVAQRAKYLGDAAGEAKILRSWLVEVG